MTLFVNYYSVKGAKSGGEFDAKVEIGDGKLLEEQTTLNPANESLIFTDSKSFTAPLHTISSAP